MAFDSNRAVTVLFGGYGTGGAFQDTWEWDGEAWTLRASTGPARRAAGAMAFDTHRNVCVLFGGGSPAIRHNDTWEWDGVAWTRRATTGPQPRLDAGMAFDADRGVVVLHGGTEGTVGIDFQDTWEWDGTTWTLRPPAGVPNDATPSLAYDAVRRVTFLYGTASWETPQRIVVAEWDGKVWGEFDEAAFDAAPAPRFGQEMVFDSARGTFVSFGGELQNGTFTHETWELRFHSPCDVNCDGSTNTFDIQAFVDVLAGPPHPPCSSCAADANADGSVNQFDIQGFVECLAG